MKTAAFQAGMMLAGLIFFTVAAVEGPRLGREVGLIGESASEEDGLVLVFVIPDDQSARRVRAAFAPDRILWQGAEGLALVGDRIVASNLEGASEVIMQAGWIERQIRIVRLDARFDDPDGGAGAGASGQGGQSRQARLKELTNKPTLTHGEQMFILSAMNDGVSI